MFCPWFYFDMNNGNLTRGFGLGDSSINLIKLCMNIRRSSLLSQAFSPFPTLQFENTKLCPSVYQEHICRELFKKCPCNKNYFLSFKYSRDYRWSRLCERKGLFETVCQSENEDLESTQKLTAVVHCSEGQKASSVVVLQWIQLYKRMRTPFYVTTELFFYPWKSI